MALHCIVLRGATQRHTAYCIAALQNFSANFFRRFFVECNLQAAIDFAELRMRGCGVGGVEQMVGRNTARSSAWQALHLSLTFSRLSVLKNGKAFQLLAPQ